MDFHDALPDMQIDSDIEPGPSSCIRHSSAHTVGVEETAVIKVGDTYSFETEHFLQGVGGHLVDNAYALPDAKEYCMTEYNRGKTDVCAQLVAQTEHPSSFHDDGWVLPFNPTEPLPPAGHRRKSISGHLLHALQSLPEW